MTENEHACRASLSHHKRSERSVAKKFQLNVKLRVFESPKESFGKNLLVFIKGKAKVFLNDLSLVNLPVR